MQRAPLQCIYYEGDCVSRLCNVYRGGEEETELLSSMFEEKIHFPQKLRGLPQTFLDKQHYLQC